LRQIIDEEFISMLEGRDLFRKVPMDGMFGGNRRSAAYGSSAEFAEYRDYIPGDDLRRIDWNLFARFDKLLTKLYVDEKQQHHRIIIDTSASMDWGQPSKFDSALKFAAALCYLAVNGLDRVSLYELKGNAMKQIGRTVATREGFYELVKELNLLKCGTEADIGAAITAEENTGGHDGITVLISDFLTDSDWKAAIDYLVFNKREVWLLQILSEDETAPGMHGKMLFLDSEGIGEEDAKNYKTEVTKSELKAYAEAFKYHQKDIKTFCDSRGVRFIPLCTSTGVERMLFEQSVEAEMIL